MSIFSPSFLRADPRDPAGSSQHHLLRILALLALMLLTRSHHLGSALHLPSASTAVFFLAGFYFGNALLGKAQRLRPSLFWLFFVAAVGMDFALYFAGLSSGHCLTLSYWALLPAYWILWQGGRLLARSSATGAAFLLTGAVCWAIAGSASYLLTNGAFYWFSGRYPDPNVAQYLERLSQYILPFVSAPLIYLAGAVALHVVLGRAQSKAAAA